MKLSHVARAVFPPLATLAAVGCAGSSTAPAAPRAPTSAAPAAPEIQPAQLEAAQRAWCDALIEISRVASSGGDARAAAEREIAKAYGYGTGTVLFKPTLASGAQTFRLTQAGAVSYFVGGDPAYPGDHGFARKGWVSCRPEIAGSIASGDLAVAMGKIHLADAKGEQVTVDKTFGYRRGPDGALKIVVHHSSLPHAPAAH